MTPLFVIDAFDNVRLLAPILIVWAAPFEKAPRTVTAPPKVTVPAVFAAVKVPDTVVELPPPTIRAPVLILITLMIGVYFPAP